MVKTWILGLLYIIYANAKLCQVVSIFRHGARYHVGPTNEPNRQPGIYGQLSPVGMKQHQRLGQILRKEYIDEMGFLSPQYNHSEIQVFSTPVDRTIQSAQSQMYGLYPPGAGPFLYEKKQLHLPPYSNRIDMPKSNPAFPFVYQPIKVKQNQMLLPVCPNHDRNFNKGYERKRDFVNQVGKRYKAFSDKIGKLFKIWQSQNPIWNVFQAYDMVNVHRYLGKPLPKQLTTDDYLNLRHFANLFYLVGWSGQSNQMLTTPKLKKILSVFDERIKNPNTFPLKWTFLSCHDSDIIALYHALNISSAQCIEELYRDKKTSALECEQGGNQFASNLIIELHSDQSQNFYVKVRSNGIYMRLCGQDSRECPYEKFKELNLGNIAKDYEKLCGKRLKTPNEEQLNKQEEIEDSLLHFESIKGKD